MSQVLLIEDDQILAIALHDGLESEGYAAQIASDGAAGLRAALDDQFELIILDLMLPRMSGFDVCRQLRAAGNETPVIMLTARSLEVEKVQGLRLGADDYITKPFSLMELLARIEAVLRRTARHAAIAEVFRFDDIELDFKRFEATKAGLPLELSPREFRILQYLIDHRGEVVSREQLLNRVWAYNAFPSTRTVDTHIAKLRQKIEAVPNHPQRLITIHGIGYKFMG